MSQLFQFGSISNYMFNMIQVSGIIAIRLASLLCDYDKYLVFVLIEVTGKAIHFCAYTLMEAKKLGGFFI